MKKLLAVGLAALLLAGCSALTTLEENIINTLLRFTNRPGVTQQTDPVEEEPEYIPGAITNITGQGGALHSRGLTLPKETPAPQPPTLQTNHTPLTKSQRYGYRLLSGAAQTLYDRLYQAVEQCLNFVDIEDIEMTRSEFNRVFQYMVQDNPQFFYLSKSYQYRYYTDNTDRPVVIILQYFDGQTTDQIDSAYQRQATADRQRIYDQRVEFNQRVAEILSRISPALGQLTKEKLAHDAVLAATEYDYEAAGSLQSSGGSDSHAFSAYGALVEGMAVCEGYSEAFQHLLTQMGMECLIVIGESQNQSHQWNMVRIGEDYYHVDPTWNDTDVFAELGILNYFYFNMSDTMISADHTVGVSGGYGYPLPRCNSSSAYYYNSAALRVGADGRILNDAAVLIDNLVLTRSPYLILLFERDAGPATIKNWMQDIFWGRNSEVLQAFEDAAEMTGVQATPSNSYYSVPKWGMAVVPIQYD